MTNSEIANYLLRKMDRANRNTFSIVALTGDKFNQAITEHEIVSILEEKKVVCESIPATISRIGNEFDLYEQISKMTEAEVYILGAWDGTKHFWVDQDYEHKRFAQAVVAFEHSRLSHLKEIHVVVMASESVVRHIVDIDPRLIDAVLNGESNDVLLSN